MNFGTKGCMYNCGDECTGECIAGYGLGTKKMSEDVLQVTINSYINTHTIKSQKEIGEVTDYLSCNYEGLYDINMASNIIKEILI